MHIPAIHRSIVAPAARRLVAVAVAVGLTAYSAMAAAAAPPLPRNLPQVVVSLQDLNLDEDRDLAILYRRIEMAAKEVCPAPDQDILKAEAVMQECRRYAIARAVEAIGNPRFAALVGRHGASS